MNATEITNHQPPRAPVAHSPRPVAPRKAVVDISIANDDLTAPTALRTAGNQKIIAFFVAAACAVLIWLSAGDHGLYTPDEGRYGVVGLHMAEGGSWLLPQFEGEIHLTKPPLEYWAIAVAIQVFGKNELAVRMPSLLAGIIGMVIILGLAWRIGGPRVAALSVGVLSLMPLFVIMSRLATTDSLLNACWLGALACGYRAVQERRSRWWPWLMWLAVAVGLMTKGPLALAPIGIILLWLTLAKNWSAFKRLHLFTGVLLAAIPLAVWVFLVLNKDGEALQIWKVEMVDRATGSPDGKHPQPWWYYLPIFLGGLFPATAMMMLPWWNAKPSRIVQEFRSGSVIALLVLAVIVPLLGFSLMSGKLASYLLPICGPLAILTGLMLEQWLKGSRGRTASGLRLPDVRITLTICIMIALVVLIGAALWASPMLAGYLLPTSLLAAACMWMWRQWNRQPHQRALCMAIVWGMWMINWWTMYEMEDSLSHERDPTRLVQRLQDLTGETNPTILSFGFTDPTLSFYSDCEVLRLRADSRGAKELAKQRAATVILVDETQLSAFQSEFAAQSADFEDVGVWQRNAFKNARILRRLQSAPVIELETAADST